MSTEWKTTWWVDVQPSPFTGDPIRTFMLDVEVEWGGVFGARSVIPAGAELDGFDDLFQTALRMLQYVAHREVDRMREILLKSLAEAAVDPGDHDEGD